MCRLAAAAPLLAMATACAPAILTLPSGPSAPLDDPAPAAAALAHCTTPLTLSAEIGLSGKVGRQRLRGTLHAGLAPPDALRLEAIAPFGGPLFVLAGRGGTATLLLPREQHVLRDAPVGDVLAALAGLDLQPADLRAWIDGCPSSAPAIERPRRVGSDWIAGEVSERRTIWLRREAASTYRLVAVLDGPLTVELADHAGAAPGRLRIRRTAVAGLPLLDLRLALREVDRGVDLADEAFVVDVPEGTEAITIEDLRASGPLRASGE